jgi:hypothetical protein
MLSSRRQSSALKSCNRDQFTSVSLHALNSISVSRMLGSLRISVPPLGRAPTGSTDKGKHCTNWCIVIKTFYYCQTPCRKKDLHVGSQQRVRTLVSDTGCAAETLTHLPCQHQPFLPTFEAFPAD